MQIAAGLVSEMIFKIRAFIFILIAGITLFPYAFFLALVSPFTQLHTQFRLSNFWTRWFVFCLKTITGINHRLHGVENLPDGPRIYFSKHQSIWETLAYQTIFPHYVWILKIEAIRIPFFGWGLASLKPIAIRRGTRSVAIEQICEQGIERLQQGLGVMIFPEGTRLLPGDKKPYKIGGAVLAKRSGAAIVPLAHNAGSFWPARHLMPVKPGTIDVVIGPAINPESLSEEEINQQVKSWIDREVGRLESSLPSAS